MATTQTIWPIEPHTEAKHQLLAQYLDAWFPILATHNKRVVFFDGFAGPGVYAGGEPGSPEIALTHLLDIPHRTASDWIKKARDAGRLEGMTYNVGRQADG